MTLCGLSLRNSLYFSIVALRERVWPMSTFQLSYHILKRIQPFLSLKQDQQASLSLLAASLLQWNIAILI